MFYEKKFNLFLDLFHEFCQAKKMSETKKVEKKIEKKQNLHNSIQFLNCIKCYDSFRSGVSIPNECQHKFISFSMQVQMSSHYLCQ